MNKEYLNKVLDQLVGETRIDYDNYMVLYPFTQPITFNKSFYLLSVSNLFTTHVPSSPRVDPVTPPPTYPHPLQLTSPPATRTPTHRYPT